VCQFGSLVLKCSDFLICYSGTSTLEGVCWPLASTKMTWRPQDVTSNLPTLMDPLSGVKFVGRYGEDGALVYMTGKSLYPIPDDFPNMYLEFTKDGKQIILDKQEDRKFKKYIERKLDLQSIEKLPNGGYLIFSQDARDQTIGMQSHAEYFDGRKWNGYTIRSGLDYYEDKE
jgi:hypothetical protein